MNKIPKHFIIKKKGTSSDYTTSEYFTSNFTENESDTSDYTYTDTDTDSYSGSSSDTESVPKKKVRRRKKRFKSIITTTYKKPKEGSKQENFTRDDVLRQLDGLIPLKTMDEKRILEHLPLFKTWVKYITLDTKQYRRGGLLMKVQYPDYITLVNSRSKLTWSVQLNNAILYIKDPRTQYSKKAETQKQEKTSKKQQKQIQITKETTEQETTTVQNSEYYDETYTETATETVTYNKEVDIIKNKLYKLYLNGQLAVKKN